MRNGLSDTGGKPAILLACDDAYMPGLIAAINSVKRNIRGAKIYLVHDLTPEKLGLVQPFIYKAEKFDSSFWRHLLPRKNNDSPDKGAPSGYISFVNQGKYQPDIIEESHYFYMDCDVVINKPFCFETPETLSCLINRKKSLIPLDPEEKPITDGFRAMQQFILSQGGQIESGDIITVYTDGAYFSNRDWMVNALRPAIQKASQNYPKGPKYFYSLDYFNAGIAMLGKPIESWKIDEAIPLLNFMKKSEPWFLPDKAAELCHLIHFIGKKPWEFQRGAYPLEGGSVWWDYYLNGPMPPVTRGLPE
ncbi:MAG: hypothetical protein V1777_02140 [Candidatus Micrarchaeota archaeon]